MSYKGRLGPIQIITNGSMGVSGLTSLSVDLSNYRGVSIQYIWTGTPTGTIGINVSNIEVNGAPGTWTALTLGSAFPSGNQPSGSAGAFYIDLDPLNCKYIQTTYTYSSGSGTLNAYLVAKGTG